MALLLAGIIIIVFLSSIFDRILRNQSKIDAEVHYKNPLDTKWRKILTLFSMRRNWNILAAPGGEEYKDLQFLHAIKTFSVFFVVLGHVCYFAEFLPSFNPEVNEAVKIKQYKSFSRSCNENDLIEVFD